MRLSPSSRPLALLSAVPGAMAARFRTDALVARLARPVVNRLVPAGRVEVVVRSGPARGLTVIADLKTEKYYWTGTHELPVQRAIAGRLAAGSRFWDVGAHAGFFTLLAARTVGAEGEVHAFEPVPENRERLLHAVALNGFGNVSVHGLAVSDRSAEMLLHAAGSSSMWSLKGSDSDDGGGMRVDCRTLDELAELLGAPDLVKVDVEGAETDVLRGGIDVLSTRRPAVIVEFSSNELLQDARAALPFYDFRRLTPCHWLLT